MSYKAATNNSGGLKETRGFSGEMVIVGQEQEPFGSPNQIRHIACCPYDDEIYLVGISSGKTEFYTRKIKIEEETIMEDGKVGPKIIMGQIETRTISGVQHLINFVCPLHNEKAIILFYHGKLVKVDLQNLQTIWEKDFQLTSIVIDRRGIIYTGNKNGKITLVDSQTGNILSSRKLFNYPIYSIGFDVNDDFVFGILIKYLTTLRVYSERGKVLKKFGFSQQTISVQTDPYNKRNYFGYYGQSFICVHDQNYKDVSTITIPLNVISSFSFILKYKYLLVLGTTSIFLLK